MNLILIIIAVTCVTFITVTESVEISIIQTGDVVTIHCETADFANAINFQKDGTGKGGCLSGGTCGTLVVGYETPTQTGTKTTMKITTCNETRDVGNWKCTYGTTPSNTEMFSTCNSLPTTEDYSTLQHNTFTTEDNSTYRHQNVTISIVDTIPDKFYTRLIFIIPVAIGCPLIIVIISIILVKCLRNSSRGLASEKTDTEFVNI